MESFQRSGKKKFWFSIMNWFKIRSNKIVFLIVIAALFGIVLILLLTSFPISGENRFMPYKTDVQYVTIEKSLNFSVNPCEDFYSFVCGHWAENLEVPPDKNALTPIGFLQDQINEKLKFIFQNTNVSEKHPHIVNSALTFFSSCIESLNPNRNYLQPFFAFVREIGGWPLLEGQSWDGSEFKWSYSGAKILQKLGIETAVGIYVVIDDTNTEQNILQIGKPRYFTKLYSDPYIIDILFYSAIITLNSSANTEFLSEVPEVLKFERALQNILNLNSTSDNFRMTFSQLTQEIPSLNWLYLIQCVTNDTLQPFGKFISENDTVLVHDVNYLRLVIALFENSVFSKRTLANWFVSKILQELYVFIPGVFQKYSNLSNFNDDEVKYTFKEKCLDKTFSSFSCALDYLYIESFSDFDIQKSRDLVHHLKNSFKNYAVEWLDSETKKHIFEKLESMIEIIGFPQNFDDKTWLNAVYEKFPVMTQNALYNNIEVTSFFIEEKIRQLVSINDRKQQSLPRSVTGVGAYYMLRRNAIVFPLSLHNPPFYFFGGPWYLNFGAIGSIIGHEITHAFDNAGHKRDRFGNIRDWWSNASAAEYKNRLACFKQQFSKYKYPGTEFKIDGLRTLGENVADSGGLRQAYMAYKDWESKHGVESPYKGLEQFSSEQLFFMSFASLWCSKLNSHAVNGTSDDVHSPNRFRVIGSVANTKYFANAFHCPEGSPMNPKQKCVMW